MLFLSLEKLKKYKWLNKPKNNADVEELWDVYEKYNHNDDILTNLNLEFFKTELRTSKTIK